MLDRLHERQKIGEAAKRIRTAHDEIVENDPELRALEERWRELVKATANARRALDASVAAALAKRTEKDRQVLEQAKRANNDLVITDDDDLRLPAICLVTGYAIFKGDDVIGDAESGFGVLRGAVKIMSVIMPNAIGAAIAFSSLFADYAGDISTLLA